MTRCDRRTPKDFASGRFTDLAIWRAQHRKRSRARDFWSELREIVFRSYRIIYRVNSVDNSLEIVRFWHGAREFPQIPRSR